MISGNQKIKNLLLSTYDIRGGAARSTYRLHEAFLNAGIDSKMLVQFKGSDNSFVLGSECSISKIMGKVRVRLDNKPLKIYRNFKNFPWSINWFPTRYLKKIKAINPDIVHLNWIGNGFISIREISKLSIPIVWTLHDMWPFTGGCHYAFECERYVDKCGKCPQLGSKNQRDLSSWILKKKYSWKKLNISVVCPSKWLADCARKSSLFGDFKITVVPYTINLNLYKPIDKKIARQILNLPESKKIILFGELGATSDKRKGFQYLIPALMNLQKEKIAEHTEIVIFGSSGSGQSEELDFKINYMGTVNDDVTLALIYSSADLFIAPSIQDNLPNTVLEALSCGTPVVAFNIGGNPDMIKHKWNGYLAEPFSIDDFKSGISWVLDGDVESLSRNSRNLAEEMFDCKKVTELYISLFREMM